MKPNESLSLGEKKLRSSKQLPSESPILLDFLRTEWYFGILNQSGSY